MSFKVGDTVQLKSGGPDMTVTRIGSAGAEPMVWCAWFEGTKGHSVETFIANYLKRAQREDVRAIVAQALRPKTEDAEARIEATVEMAREKLTTIMSYDLGSAAVRVPDQLRAIELLAKLNGWMAPDRHELAVTVGRMSAIEGISDLKCSL